MPVSSSPRHPSAAPTGRQCLFLALAGVFLAGVLIGPTAAAPPKKKTTTTTSAPKATRRSTKGKKAKEEQVQRDRPDSWYENAWREFEMGSATEKKAVMASLRKILKKDPSDGLAHYYLGIMQAQEGPLKQAEEHLRAALQAWPESADVMSRLAEVLMERKQPDEAFALYEKVRQVDPRHAGALGNLGLKALQEERFDEAIDLLTQARAGAPEDRQILESLGAALSARNRHAEAIEVLQAALRLDESSAEAHWLLGKAYEATNKPAEAAAALEKARRFGRKEKDLKKLIGFDLARALNDTGKVEEAIAEYQKAIRTSDDPATGWFELAEIYEARGDDDKAIKAYDKAISLDAKRGEAPLRIGKIYRAAGDLDKALTVFKGIERRPDVGEQAKIEIEEIEAEKTEARRTELADLASTGSEDQREKAYRQMLELNKADQEAYDGLIELAKAKGDLSQVEFYYKEMKKVGLLTKDQLAQKVNELSYRQDAGEDLAAWENRLEEFKRKGEWDKALAENEKIKAYNKSQLEYWKKFSGDKDLKAEMLRATKARLQSNAETAKDIKAAKNRFK